MHAVRPTGTLAAVPVVLFATTDDDLFSPLALQLTARDCEVVRATSAGELLEAVRHGVIDCAIVNPFFRDVWYGTAVAALRADSATAHIPVALVSATTPDREWVELFDLVAPLPPDDFDALVGELAGFAADPPQVRARPDAARLAAGIESVARVLTAELGDGRRFVYGVTEPPTDGPHA